MDFMVICGIYVFIICMVFIRLIIGPWLTIYLGLSALPNPAKPEITHAEFPFTLTFSINGEQKIIKDVLICDYDGIGIDEGHGKYRKWKSHLASGEKRVLLFKSTNLDHPFGWTNNQKLVKQEIYYNPGDPGYYMGDPDDIYSSFKPDFPNASVYELYDDGHVEDGPIIDLEDKDKFEMFYIKLIHWSFPKPIKNKFY
jgi:hypothetical protein